MDLSSAQFLGKSLFCRLGQESVVLGGCGGPTDYDKSTHTPVAFPLRLILFRTRVAPLLASDPPQVTPLFTLHFIEPMNALGVRDLPDGNWIYELKFDGYRALAFKADQEVRVALIRTVSVSS